MTAAPANAELVAFMRQVWDEAAVAVREVDEDEGWRAVQARVAAVAPHSSSSLTQPAPADVPVVPLHRPPQGGRSWHRGWRRWAAAAAAVVIAAAGTSLWQTRSEESAPRAVMREYATARGQRAEVMLDDGTRVWLNVASRLRIFGGYGDTVREVQLDGEAYFAVKHDPERPFRVHSRGAVTEDLGTEFDVRAYADEPATTITVTAGRVAIRSGATPGEAGPVLDRGRTARVDSVGRVTVADADPVRATGWREGQLTFQERPLADALRELGRWYDLEIVVDDSSLARVPLTASLGQRTGDQEAGQILSR
jgi:ferric-dicitrate binding protein FerR (iron transport regulator)